MAAQVLAEVSERIGRALVGKFNGANKAATTTTTAAVVAAADNNNNNDDSKATVVDNLKMAERMEIFPFFPSSSSLWQQLHVAASAPVNYFKG